MPFLLIYILKLSVSLGVVFTFYHFVLRKLTFYNWNRWYLLGYSFLSFFIALIDITPVLERNEWSQKSIVQWVPVIQTSVPRSEEMVSPASLSAWQWFILLIIAGMLVMLVRLLVQLASFRRLMRKAEPIAIGVIPGSSMKLYHVEEDIIPFSFGNSIFINHRLHTKDELQEIVWHEFIHVKQKHSLDIIAGEILCLLNWYNPFAWLIRRSMRENLEFIADDKVLENGVNRKEYQYLLLKVIGNKHFSIAPKFNFSSLKKRIAMMNKMKSAGVHIVKFLFILPLVAVLLVAFRNNNDKQPLKQPTVKPGIRTGERVIIYPPDTVPAVRTVNSKDYLIDIIGVNGNCTVVVKDKSGKEVERVSLDKWKEDGRFEEKYGEILPPPPPVAAAAPVEAVVSATPVSPVSAATPVAPVNPALPVRFPCEVTTTTPVAAISGNGINLSRISREYEITDKKATLKLLDGTTENYDLTNAKERSAFENKYGRIISVPANVNGNVSTTVKGVMSPKVVSNGVVSTTIAPAVVMGSGSATAVSTTYPGEVAVIDDYGHVITGNEDIVVTITKKTTRQELDKFIALMKEKGIGLSFEEIEYNSKGILVAINGSMKSKDGSQSNFVASDFESITLAMIKKGEKTWFKVSTKDREVI